MVSALFCIAVVPLLIINAEHGIRAFVRLPGNLYGYRNLFARIVILSILGRSVSTIISRFGRILCSACARLAKPVSRA